MSKILQVLQLLIGIVPLVITLMKQFETPGFGAEKKKAVLDSIGVLYDQLGITAITKEKLLGIVGALCDIFVGLFNIIGWFKDSNPIPNI